MAFDFGLCVLQPSDKERVGVRNTFLQTAEQLLPLITPLPETHVKALVGLLAGDGPYCRGRGGMIGHMQRQCSNVAVRDQPGARLAIRLA